MVGEKGKNWNRRPHPERISYRLTGMGLKKRPKNKLIFEN